MANPKDSNGKRAYQIIITILTGLLLLAATGFVDDIRGQADKDRRIAALEAQMDYIRTDVVKRLDRLEMKIDALSEGHR
ncbi:MAG TPA: hypothetical protein PKG98_08125 [Myxococcota bacterium]|nr:hypothetical protein [Myxococcota bacterium]